MNSEFLEKYSHLSREKDSYLCVGLDPAVPSMRDKFVIPKHLFEGQGLTEGIVRFCIGIIEAVSEYTALIKINAWYLFPVLGFEQTKQIVEAVKRSNCLAFVDAKLTDIGETNAAALHWIESLGFDAVTFSPFSGYKGGTDVIYKWAKDKRKGIFVLCKMSNPGAGDYQSRPVGGTPMYKTIAQEAVKLGAQGFVVGATYEHELGEIRNIIGEDRLILAPGLGPQGGNPEAAFRLGANKLGQGLIVSASRSIDYAYENLSMPEEQFVEAARVQARRERDRLNSIRLKVLEEDKS